MSYSKAVKETFQKEFSGEKGLYDYNKLNKERLIGFRKEKESVVRLEKPTNLPRARTLGYKAKKGIFVVRVRARKGSGTKTRPNRARRPKRMGIAKLTRRKSIQAIAETRASKKHPNCEVLNSYWIGEDGKHKYFEVILVDVNAPEIKSDKDLKWLTEKQHKGRSERGLTSAGKKSRGMKYKKKSTHKVRPSRRSNQRQN
ncbi:50S ribosomal protein L15e [Candidatus Micrarchaeota archaeon]|nr:50S ribosomal protein L15e [Candidatus Micrarchaeota archaeon]MBU2476349.1 50S ribosomal protein L15e [Candidatus Micrarchaeota archaeon]